MVTTRRQSGVAPSPTRKAAAAAAAKKTAKKVHYEFMGPPGALSIIVGLPLVCYALVLFCNADQCVRLDLSNLPSALPSPPGGMPLFTPEACAVFLGWMAYCVALHLILPGVRKQGVQLSNGERLTYKLNGMLIFLVTMAIVGYGVWTDQLDLGWVHDNFLALLTAGNAFAFALSAYLYASSPRVATPATRCTTSSSAASSTPGWVRST